MCFAMQSTLLPFSLIIGPLWDDSDLRNKAGTLSYLEIYSSILFPRLTVAAGSNSGTLSQRSHVPVLTCVVFLVALILIKEHAMYLSTPALSIIEKGVHVARAQRKVTQNIQLSALHLLCLRFVMI